LLLEAHQAILVESELCSLVLQSQASEVLSSTRTVPIALGGASGGRGISSLSRLAIPSKVFIALDNDEAGHKSSTWWLQTIPNSERVIPTQKDIGDMYTSGDEITTWLSHFLVGGKSDE